jgi:outer membrane protein W
MPPAAAARRLLEASMTKRIACTIALVLLFAPASAFAQIHQVGTSHSSSDTRSTVDFSLGYIGQRGIDSRPSDDVIVGDLVSAHPLLFTISDLNGVIAGGDYLYAITRNIEVGVGVSFAQRTVASIYADLTHPNGDEIQQDVKLRQIPVSFTGRFLILPRGSAVEPYVGAGLVAIRYHYSEVGEFVDADGTIFPGSYVADGVATGPVVLAGVRAPIDHWTIGGELRWHRAEAHGLSQLGFLGDTLDLGSWQVNFTAGVRF